MMHEHELQKKQMEEKAASLEKQIKQLREDNKLERQEIEQKAWEEIDKVKDENKERLTAEIQRGMQNKGKLTEVTGKHKT